MYNRILYKLLVPFSKFWGKLCGVLYSEKTSKNFRYFQELVTTYQYRKRFNTIGKNSIISKIRRLDGAKNITK